MEDRPHVIIDLLTDRSSVTWWQLLKSAKRHCTVDLEENTTILCHELVKLEPLSSCKATVSDDSIEAMFQTKCRLDEANITHICLVTSYRMKKYWEYVCFLLLTPIHTWSVLGVDVNDQSSAYIPQDVSEIESSIKNYLMTINGSGDVNVLRSQTIPGEIFNAGFHTRQGGVSQLPSIASLNMLYTARKPDSPLVINENRRRLACAAHFDPGHLHIAKSEHGKTIWVMGHEQPTKYDGIVTNIPGVTVAAPGADCCVVLLADTKTGACGAVHAGWMGTVSGAVREAVTAMVDSYGSDPLDIHAAIGPSVEGKCFDMPAKEAKVISDLDPSLTWPSTLHEGWMHTDLQGANAVILQKAGIAKENIDLSTASCTACNRQLFFSHRRDRVPFGNQLGFISCRKKPLPVLSP